MKQIAYLSMVFLPASFVAVCLHFESFWVYYQISLECFWNERERDRARYQGLHTTLCCDHHWIYASQRVGDYCLPEQVYFPAGCDILEATGLACVPPPATFWKGSICANDTRHVRRRYRIGANDARAPANKVYLFCCCCFFSSVLFMCSTDNHQTPDIRRSDGSL